MAAWITPPDVDAVYPGDIVTDAQIAHVQRLAHVHIGDQDPPPDGLVGVMVEIMHRFHDAKGSPTNVRTEQLGPSSTTYVSVSGFGLTDREIDQLKQAAGVRPGLWVQPTYRHTDEDALWPTTLPDGVTPGEPIHGGP